MTNAATSRLRCATVLLAVMSLAVMAAIAPATAQAASSRLPATASLTRQSPAVPAGAEYECLTNDSGLCMSQEVVVIANNVIIHIGEYGSAAGVLIYIVKKAIGIWNNPGKGKHTKGKDTQLTEVYMEYDGDTAGAAPKTNECMAAAQTFSIDVTWEPCGANGTVWVEQPDNNGGNFMFDRYSLDNGCTLVYPGYDSSGPCMVMSSDAQNGDNIFTDYPNGAGGAFYQDWNP
jgi:hypothetical protein